MTTVKNHNKVSKKGKLFSVKNHIRRSAINRMYKQNKLEFLWNVFNSHQRAAMLDDIDVFTSGSPWFYDWENLTPMQKSDISKAFKKYKGKMK